MPATQYVTPDLTFAVWTVVAAAVSGVCGYLGGLLRDWLNTKAQKAQIIHRLQFETEFQTCQNLWREARLARSKVLTLAPVDLGNSAYDSPHHEQYAMAALQKFSELVAIGEPFLAKSVYAVADEMRLALAMHVSHYEKLYKGKQFQKYAEWAAKTDAEARDAEKRLCSEIRKRIGTFE